MKIVIKVGTQAILSDDGTVIEKALRSLVEQIVKLHQEGHQVVLVSSGAVSSGRRIARELLGKHYGHSIGEKQLLASLGQPELMRMYGQLFKPYGVLTAQLLLTKQDFQTRQHYLNIARILREISASKNIIPIINENDSVTIEELMFTDNDELAGLLAAQINVDKFIILTSVKGVYDGHPSDPHAKLMTIIDPQESHKPEISLVKTTHGRGGMITKLGTARKMSTLGITTHIASINEPNVIIRLLQGESLGTTILPNKKKSNIKRWIAFSNHPQNGIVCINENLVNILKENKRAISLLPVGIISFSGHFKKGDLVEIATPDGKKIGIGIARYGSDKLSEYLGLKGKPALIHYDYLHIKGDI